MISKVIRNMYFSVIKRLTQLLITMPMMWKVHYDLYICLSCKTMEYLFLRPCNTVKEKNIIILLYISYLFFTLTVRMLLSLEKDERER